MSGLKVLAIFGQVNHSRVDNTQTNIIAEELAKGGILYKKDVFFNMLINLPSFLLAIIPVWLLVKHIDDFKDIDDCDLIVVSGKKMIRYARHIRKHMFPGTKIVQIGNPYCSIRKNDILIRQEWSKFILTCKNTIKINGLLCEKIPKETEERESKRCEKISSMLKGPYIGVFIGGNKFSYHLTKKEAEEFAKIISIISYNMKMPLLILTDKKVNKDIINTIKNNLDCSYYFYEDTNNIDNPKVAFMCWSSYYILTGNSINDHSEYIAQEKPTYIYKTIKNTKRYNKFLNKLIENKNAKLLTNNIEYLDEFVPEKLNNIEELAIKVKNCL